MLLKLMNYFQTSAFFLRLVCWNGLIDLSFLLFRESDDKSIWKQAEQQLRKAVAPCCKQLEKNLQQVHIYRQAWHGGTFVGNHVHKMLEVSAKAEFKLSCQHNAIFVAKSWRPQAEQWFTFSG